MERGGKRLLLENIIGLVICLDYPRDFQHHPDYTRGGVDPLHDYAPPQSKSGRKFAIGLIFLALVLGVWRHQQRHMRHSLYVARETYHLRRPDNSDGT